MFLFFRRNDSKFIIFTINKYAVIHLLFISVLAYYLLNLSLYYISDFFSFNFKLYLLIIYIINKQKQKPIQTNDDNKDFKEVKIEFVEIKQIL